MAQVFARVLPCGEVEVAVIAGPRVPGVRLLAGVAALMLLSAGAGVGAAAAGSGSLLVGPNATVPPAHCGSGSVPEDGVQGEVPLKDRQDGRSQLGYRCNLVLVGQYQGVGAGWQNAWYGNCDYYDTAQNTTAPGVQVIDASNPAHPQPTARLTSPAMLGPWESLKVNQPRGLLGAVAAYDGAGQGPLFFDVYSVKTDCAHPTLLSSTPMDVPFGHEGNWAPDGMTYYGSTASAGTLAAIDVSNPALPRLLNVFRVGTITHGLSVSDDGNTLYAADIVGSSGSGNGLEIYDVSQIQSRSAAPVTTEIGHVYWTDGSTAQSTIPISYHGHPYILFFDEGGAGSSLSTTGVPAGAARIIDIANPAAPKIISVLRLAIQTPKYAKQNQAEVAGNGGFGYEAHYCVVDREHDPTAVACGYFQSGIRVFDIRNPYQPREIAYFNPPAQVAKHGQLPGSEHAGGVTNIAQPPNLTADWCTSQIRFDTAADGSHELWAQCQDNGFMVLKFTNGVYPLPALPASGTAGAVPARAPVAATVPSGPRAAASGSSLPRTGGSSLLALGALVAVATGLAVLRRTRINRRGAWQVSTRHRQRVTATANPVGAGGVRQPRSGGGAE
ncbi:MAG TPA: hypothetical protein VNG13_13370 [Mycobacteriales bacterium]|nr:hypothetical protein [Mycobacteriales bacterium]